MEEDVALLERLQNLSYSEQYDILFQRALDAKKAGALLQSLFLRFALDICYLVALLQWQSRGSGRRLFLSPARKHSQR